jgi:hypothetical protein
MWRSKLGNEFPRAEVEKLDAEHHRMLKKLRSQPGNDRCAECSAQDTTWSSVNLGVFLCVRCADVHRALGTHISKVKGCGGTYLWGADEIAQMQRLGNRAWASETTHVDSSTSKEEMLRICRRKYENKPLPQTQNQVDAITNVSRTSTAQFASHGSTAGDGPAKAMSSASKCPSMMKIKSQKKVSEKALDLDSFFDHCLKAPESDSKASFQSAGPSASESDSLDWCVAPTPTDPAQDCQDSSSHMQPNGLDWCFAPVSHSKGTSPTQAGAAQDSKCDSSLFQPNDLDLCFAPAPPHKGAVCRSLSGFDFDSFFDECVNPSNEEKASSLGKVERKESPVSQQRSAFESFQQIPMTELSQSMTHQSSPTEFPEMKFDSDAFFNDFLGSTGNHSCANSFKTSSVIW